MTEMERECTGMAYDVGSDNLAVEVDADAVEADTGAQPLGFIAQPRLVEGRREGVRREDALGRVLSKANVIPQDFFDGFLVGLLVMGHILEGRVGRHKECVIGFGAIQQLHDAGGLVYNLGKLGRVLAVLDELVDGQVVVLVLVVVVVAGQDVRELVRKLVAGVLDSVDGAVKRTGQAVGGLSNRRDKCVLGRQSAGPERIVLGLVGIVGVARGEATLLVHAEVGRETRNDDCAGKGRPRCGSESEPHDSRKCPCTRRTSIKLSTVFKR